jgi:hypothetical protein
MVSRILAPRLPRVNKRKGQINDALELIHFFHKATGHSDPRSLTTCQLSADIDAAQRLLTSHGWASVQAVICAVATGMVPGYRVTRLVHLLWKWTCVIRALRELDAEAHGLQVHHARLVANRLPHAAPDQSHDEHAAATVLVLYHGRQRVTNVVEAILDETTRPERVIRLTDVLSQFDQLAGEVDKLPTVHGLASQEAM